MSIYFDEDDEKSLKKAGVVIAVLISIIFLCWLTLAFIKPQINLYTQRKQGEAELIKSESNRKIITVEAKQKLEAAQFSSQTAIKISEGAAKAKEIEAEGLAKAEVLRDKGVAEANMIIADGLGGADGYLKYLWITNLGGAQLIYVPTEAGLPILEAGKRP